MNAGAVALEEVRAARCYSLPRHEPFLRGDFQQLLLPAHPAIEAPDLRVGAVAHSVVGEELGLGRELVWRKQ